MGKIRNKLLMTAETTKEKSEQKYSQERKNTGWIKRKKGRKKERWTTRLKQ